MQNGFENFCELPKLRRTFSADFNDYTHKGVVFHRGSGFIFFNECYDLSHRSNTDLVPVRLDHQLSCKSAAGFFSPKQQRPDDDAPGENSPRLIV